MLETLESYIYTGVSFSTFSFDKVSFLCLKYKLSFVLKRYYLYLIKKELSLNLLFHIDRYSINYFINSTLNSLSNATLVLNPTRDQLKLAKRYLKRKVVLHSTPFKIVDLSSEIKTKPTCFVLNSKNDYQKYAYIVNNFSKVSFIFLDDILEEQNNNEIKESIFDEIKLRILKDNDSEVFFIDLGIFTNLINDFAFSLNKIAINLF